MLLKLNDRGQSTPRRCNPDQARSPWAGGEARPVPAIDPARTRAAEQSTARSETTSLAVKESADPFSIWSEAWWLPAAQPATRLPPPRSTSRR